MHAEIGDPLLSGNKELSNMISSLSGIGSLYEFHVLLLRVAALLVFVF